MRDWPWTVCSLAAWTELSPQLFLLPPSRAAVIDMAKQDQPQVGLQLGGCWEWAGGGGVTQALSMALPDNTGSAL